MIGPFVVALGRVRLGAGRQSESGGNDRTRLDRASAGGPDRRVEPAQLQAKDRRRHTNAHQLPRRRGKTGHVRAQDVLTRWQRVEREVAGLVGHRRGHGDAEHGDHRARQRAAALVTDTAADPPARDVRGVTLDRGRGDQACGLRLRWCRQGAEPRETDERRRAESTRASHCHVSSAATHLHCQAHGAANRSTTQP